MKNTARSEPLSGDARRPIRWSWAISYLLAGVVGIILLPRSPHEIAGGVLWVLVGISYVVDDAVVARFKSRRARIWLRILLGLFGLCLTALTFLYFRRRAF